MKVKYNEYEFDHSDSLVHALGNLESLRKMLLSVTGEMIKADGGKMFSLDLFAFGAVKKSLSLIDGLKKMVKGKNILCARALLRVHIDTSLRFTAPWLVENPHDFSTKVLAGISIRDLRDMEGKKMTDAYLVKIHSKEYQWLPIVYKNTSGFIHLSGDHMIAAMNHVGDDGKVSFALTHVDDKYPEFSWLEIIDYCSAATGMFLRYLEGWVITKNDPKQVRKIREESVNKKA